MSEPIWSGWRLQQDGNWWGRWTATDANYVHIAAEISPGKSGEYGKRWRQREARAALDRYLQAGVVTLAPREEWAEFNVA